MMKLRVQQIRKTALIHVGSMDQTRKSPFSHEGKCLSVSDHPKSWVRIAKLGGRPWWRLENEGGLFVNFYDLIDAENIQPLFRWGVGRGLLTTTTGFAVSYHDDELEGVVRYYTCDPSEAADAKANGRSVKRVKRLACLTDAGAAACGINGGNVAFAKDGLAIALAEELGLDGVWWDEDDDPDRYSAPRGGILPSALKRWAIKEVSF